MLQQTGAATFLEPRWWNVGYAKLTTDEELAYLGIPGLRIAGGQGVAIIAFCQVRVGGKAASMLVLRFGQEPEPAPGPGTGVRHRGANGGACGGTRRSKQEAASVARRLQVLLMILLLWWPHHLQVLLMFLLNWWPHRL